MTTELVDALYQEPLTRFYVGVVESIRADGLLDLIIGSPGDPDIHVPRYQGVAYLDSYVPQVYDKVHFLTHQTRKSLVLGKAYDGSTTSMTQAAIQLDLAPGWSLVRGRAARRAGVVVLNAEVRSPDQVVDGVVGVVGNRRHRPQGVPAALAWVADNASGGGKVDDVSGEITLQGAVPATSLILISSVWDSIGERRHG